MYQRKDGTVLTADCPVGVRRKRVRRVAAFAIAGGGLAALASLATTRTKGSIAVRTGDVEVETTPTMGTAVPDPPPVPEGIGSSMHTMGVVALPMEPKPAASAHPAPPVKMGKVTASK
jgi:hypothetical protein